MSGVSSTEKRRSQDGGFQAVADGFSLDMRLSTMPSIYGESVVLRILDRRYIDTLSIDELGFTEHNKQRYLALMNNPNGILAVTGPTGSGKTSTIYTSLKLLNTGERAIHSIEDPVEYRLSGIVSTQVNDRAGVTVATGMRSLVRQDPDIIFIGETRDTETAQMAMGAANTGQFVLTTLHTNDSVSAIARLMNLGVKPFQMVDAFLGATAQVLVRRLCFECGGTGCPVCNHSGFYGRMPLQEVMIFSDAMKEALMSSTNPFELRKIAVREGLITMMDDGFAKADMGITTREEVLRVAKKNNLGAGYEA
jgi:type IV pilus assembly protein PilB